jgi:hypothetical protein
LKQQNQAASLSAAIGVAGVSAILSSNKNANLVAAGIH